MEKTEHQSKNALSAPDDWVNITDTKKDQRYPNVFSENQTGAFLSVHRQQEQGIIEVKTSSDILIHIVFWRDDICQVKYIHPLAPETSPYALEPTRTPLVCKYSIFEQADWLDIKGEKIQCRIHKKDCKIEFMDVGDGSTILAEAEAYQQRSSIQEGIDQVKVSFNNHENDYFFGLGDKTWNLNLNGRSFENWNTDAFAYHKERDPLYRTIPFYYGIKDEKSYGLFLNNTYRSHFDFNSKNNQQTTIWAEGGAMDYFFFYGNNLNEVAQSYHYLTGTPELPPLWLLGFHQCRWSYYPESRVKKLADQFREHKIPCDALYLDIDYMDDYRCFTWNKEHFPAPTEMISELKEQGFHTVVMIDPGIKVDETYPVFKTGMKENAFCKRSNGELMVGPVWPAKCVWPDYTNKKTREWWGELYEELYIENGVSGFWNDMNEPAVFKTKLGTFPDDVIHDNNGHPTNHKAVHNIYGQQMSVATTDGLKKLNPQKRPFLLARATFSGGQRHAAIWTGDNIANWEQLQLANRQCQRLSISGFSLVGTDIGGFVDQPEPELFIRWLQLGIFHPLFRTHSMGNNADGSGETDKEAVAKADRVNRFDREPWSMGEPYTSQARQAIEFRYQLIPYIYTSLYFHSLNGLPLIRSISFGEQFDHEALKKENEFFFGEHLLISPITSSGVQHQATYLPKGDWLDYETGELFAGQQEIQKAVDENSIPIYVRAGAVIPHYPTLQYTGEKAIEQVYLKAYFGQEGVESHFYQDKGEGYDYLDGQYRLHHFTTHSTPNSFSIEQEIKGNIDDDLTTFEIKFYGLPFSVNELYIDGIKQEETDKDSFAKGIVLSCSFSKIELR